MSAYEFFYSRFISPSPDGNSATLAERLKEQDSIGFACCAKAPPGYMTLCAFCLYCILLTNKLALNV